MGLLVSTADIYAYRDPNTEITAETLNCRNMNHWVYFKTKGVPTLQDETNYAMPESEFRIWAGLEPGSQVALGADYIISKRDHIPVRPENTPILTLRLTEDIRRESAIRELSQKQRAQKVKA